MKNILMVAGTSLLENTGKYFKEVKNDDNAIEYFKEITMADKFGNTNKANRYANKLDEVVKEFFKKGVKLMNDESEWVENISENYTNEDASDEIKSIIELQKEAGEKIQVHLIASDTVASEKCAELIKYFFEDKEKIDIEITKVLNLQIFNENNLNTAELPNKNVDIICLNGCSIEYIPILINKYPETKLRTIILQDIKYKSKNIPRVSWGCYRDKY